MKKLLIDMPQNACDKKLCLEHFMINFIKRVLSFDQNYGFDKASF